MLSGLIAVAAILAIVAGFLLLARKAGNDTAEAQANKDALNEIVDANRPADPAELDRVRRKYNRD